MKKLRAILVLLLSLSLPWSALANGMRDMHCHHHDGGMSGMSMQHVHDADQGCEHMRKCECQHHCAGGSMAAVFVPIDTNLGLPAGPAFDAASCPARISQARPASPFRPPIAAPAGAA